MKLLIKIGGTLVDEPVRLRSLARQIAALHHAENRIAVVHGGGRQLTRFLEERGIESRFVDGLRVTAEDTMDAVVKVLAGTVNKQLTGALRAEGVNAVGLSGMDGNLATAEQLSPELGHVGRVTAADASLLELLTLAGYVPVVACVAGDAAGRAWNINADQMAVACAAAFSAEQLIFLTDVAGVMDADGRVLAELSRSHAQELIASGVARGGMRAKLDAAILAVAGGVPSVVIAPGAEDAILPRLLAGEPCGTRVR